MIKAKPVEFKLYAPQAKCVSLAGSFNNWDTKANNTKKDSKGNWSTKISLESGRHEYKFFVDGTWLNDPSCTSCQTNAFGSQNCVVEIK
ncbi:MAG: isoamylase early set domain-containing protein [Candidatus Omnitrophota bacterium]|nr:isoamylase early set domain-containing protein [Candidatus Omnitrophota bacterium]